MQLDTEFWSANMESNTRSRIITGVNGLDIHILESGYENPENPTILLLHGFPEIAYSSVSYTHLTLPTIYSV